MYVWPAYILSFYMCTLVRIVYTIPSLSGLIGPEDQPCLEREQKLNWTEKSILCTPHNTYTDYVCLVLCSTLCLMMDSTLRRLTHNLFDCGECIIFEVYFISLGLRQLCDNPYCYASHTSAHLICSSTYPFVWLSVPEPVPALLSVASVLSVLSPWH